MGNKKNVRKRMPTAKKMAADSDPADDSDSPPRQTSSTRPKPRPTYKGSTKDPKRARAEASDPIAQTSKKAVNRRQSVTSAESDASMDNDAGEDEVIEIDEEDWDEEDEEEEDGEEPEVKGHQRKATARSAPGM
jgi:hypothetical protein